MRELDSMSAAVREVIDAYPVGHEFYGNQLKDDVVRIYPEAVNMYPDTILRMARRHRRYAFCVVSQNDSLYKKTAVIPIAEQLKAVAPKPEPPVIHHPCVSPVQGFLFSFLLLVSVFFILISYNTAKTLVSLSGWKVKIEKNFQISQNFFEKSLSLLHFRHDHFSMSNRTNIRQPGKPATERHSIEAKGVFYDNDGRQSQKSS
jgi:hypothetical protein